MAGKGRPSSYTTEIADEICEQIAEGKSLRTICRDEKMPAMSTIFKWLTIHEEFTEQYTRAKDNQADALAEDIQDISQKTLKGEYDPQAARVALDAYKWTASKLKPKKYGDRLELDGKTEVTHKYKDMDDEQLEKLIQARANRAA